jgi:hypothetical protein
MSWSNEQFSGTDRFPALHNEGRLFNQPEVEDITFGELWDTKPDKAWKLIMDFRETEDGSDLLDLFLAMSGGGQLSDMEQKYVVNAKCGFRQFLAERGVRL